MGKWLLIVSGVLITAYIFLSGGNSVRVQTATAALRDLSVTVQEQGQTRAYLPFVVTAPVTGHLQRHEWIAGDVVAQGDELATLALVTETSRDTAALRANLAAATARRESAQAVLAEAETTLERATREAQRRERLFLDRLISEEEHDTYLQTLAATQSRVNSARATLAASAAEQRSAAAQLMGLDAEDNSSAVKLHAPSSGTIHTVFERGDRVVSAGTPLLEISNQDAMEVVVDLLTQDAVRVRPGATIEVRDWGGDQIVMGTVDYIEPRAFTKYSALGVEEQRVNVIGTLQRPPAELGAGYRIEAAIVVWQQAQVLSIPAGALFRRDEQWQVFVAVDGRARLRQVSIGERNREYAQVLAGLEAGEQVIVFPSDLVQNGVAIDAR
ncbi:MAG: hypothetical protein CMK70_10825 [Pseudohongiella sp.]|nr:hypothetical protein [Pseudohongiella sp.]|tara:strand:- start:95695 stop:96849 length:1155 start_codon:yes stop_codon:yes gene_type:complete